MGDQLELWSPSLVPRPWDPERECWAAGPCDCQSCRELAPIDSYRCGEGCCAEHSWKARLLGALQWRAWFLDRDAWG